LSTNDKEDDTELPVVRATSFSSALCIEQACR